MTENRKAPTVCVVYSRPTVVGGGYRWRHVAVVVCAWLCGFLLVVGLQMNIAGIYSL